MNRYPKDINDMIDNISGSTILAGLAKRCHKIQDGACPMNEVYWQKFKNIDIDDKSINMRHFRYVDYIDFLNYKIKPFKR